MELKLVLREYSVNPPSSAVVMGKVVAFVERDGKVLPDTLWGGAVKGPVTDAMRVGCIKGSLKAAGLSLD